VTIFWDIPANQTPGSYRITYYCDHRELGGQVKSAQGSSKTFKVTTSQEKVEFLNNKWERKAQLLNKINAWAKEENKKALHTNILKPQL